MAAGLGFKDFTTGEVLTAADVDGYLMQGIWVFASAAARDAAVTSPQEGNFAFLKDTNTTTYYTGSAWTNLDTTGMVNPMTTTGDMIYSSSGSTPARLGLGTANQQLRVNAGATAPEWFTPAAGGGGLTFITGGTISASSTINVNNCFTSTYANYKIILNISSAGGAFIIPMRLRASGTDTSSGYNTQRYRGDNATYAGFENQDGTTYWTVCGSGSGTTTMSLEYEIYSPQLARNTTGVARGQAVWGSDHAFDVGCGLVLADTTQYDGFSWVPTSTVTGEYRVYGYQNS